MIKKNNLKFKQFAFSIGIVLALFFSGFVGIFTNENSNYTNSKNLENNKNIDEEKIKENLANLKGHFTKNQGQIENKEIFFTYSSKNINFGFSESSVLIKLTKELDNNTTKSSIIKLTFEKSNNVIPKGQEELNHKNNYFIGNDSSKWQSNVPNYEKIIYQNLYDGIDLVYYFNEDGLKYDWNIKPKADPTKIVERFEGIDSINLDPNGELIIKTKFAELKENKPYSYQKIFGNIIDVEVSFKIFEKNKITYNIGNYEISQNLIIDPLIYSTLIGGTGTDAGHDVSIALDSDNNAYITGDTNSNDFPTTLGSLNESHIGWDDVFVFKLNQDGSDLVYCTYVGGDDNHDYAYGIALDNESNVYVTGETGSKNFPNTTGCYDKDYNGNYDVFVFKLNSDGSSLLYSTLVGGNNHDFGNDIVLDSENNTYVTGDTSSENFPNTTGCYDDELNGTYDVFVFKLNWNGSDLLYSTFVGGNDNDSGNGIAIDSNNNIYVTGNTASNNFPNSSGSYNGSSDVFVFKMNSNGSKLIYSTFIGGNNFEEGRDIAIDSKNNTYITGYTQSDDFPNTTGCYDSMYNGGGLLGGDVFVTKLNSEGSNLIYSTFIGGGNDDFAYEIVLDSENNVYITGITFSDFDFPTTLGCFDDENHGNGDTFVVKLNMSSNGKKDMLYSTFVGGSNVDFGYGIVLDSKNNAYIVGSTESEDFPNPYNKPYNGSGDVFVLKLNLLTPIIDSIFPNPANESETVYFYGNGTNSGTVDSYYWNSSIDGFLSNKQSFNLSNLSNGTHIIYLKVKDKYDIWSNEVNITLTINGIPRAEINEIKPNPAYEGEIIYFYGNGTDDGTINNYNWNSSINGFLSNTNSFNLTNLSSGIHTIYFKVKDKFGVWSEIITKTLIIEKNQKPTAIIDSISPNPAKKGKIVEFNGTGLDPDGNIEKYEWDFNGDGTWDWNSITIGNTTYVYNDTGIYYVKFRVTDNSRTSDIDNYTIYVNNSLPIVTNVSIYPAPPLTTKICPRCGYYVPVSHIRCPNCHYFLYPPQPPPPSLSYSHNLKVKYDYFDEDGDEENGTIYKWYKNEGYGFNLTDLTSKTIGFENTTIGMEWKCDVIPKDGIEFGLPINSTEVEIITFIPIIINNTINLENPKTTDDLSVSYVYCDIDNDTEKGTSFKWYKDTGKGFVEANINTQSLSSDKTSKGERWKCEITPKNDLETGLSNMSTIVTILNTPPSITNLFINLSKPFTTDEFSVNYEFNDIDGDTEKDSNFKWYKDVGNGFINANINTKFVSSEKTSRGEKWKCEVTPKDGEEFGNIFSSNIIKIKNTIPIPIISSPKDGNIYYENAIIHFDATNSTDADDDKITFVWFLNGEEISSEIKFNKKLTIGNYTILLNISDGFGSFNLKEINFCVINPIEINIFIDGTPRVNEKIKIFVKIYNLGIIDLFATIKFYEDKIDDSCLIGIVNEISLLASLSCDVSIDWTPKTKGTHTIIVIIENCKPIPIIPKEGRKTVEVAGRYKKDIEPPVKSPEFIFSIGLLALLTFAVAGTEIGKYNFLLLFFLPLYTRIKKEKLLDNEARGMIRGYIIANPGDYYSSIKRVLGFQNGKLMYHLQVLEKNGMIRSETIGTTKRFYPVGYKSPNAQRVLNIIRETPELSQKEIVAQTKIKQQTISRILTQMVEEGQIREEKIGRKKYYYFKEAKKDTPFKNCPFCGKDFKVGKTPQFCPYCKEQLLELQT